MGVDSIRASYARHQASRRIGYQGKRVLTLWPLSSRIPWDSVVEGFTVPVDLLREDAPQAGKSRMLFIAASFAVGASELGG